MRPEDLIPAFLDCLELQETLSAADSRKCKEIRAQIEAEEDEVSEYYESEEAGWTLEDLSETLDSYAPPYFYFGAHEGDGCDYGFWLSRDSLEIAIYDGDVLKVNDLADIPKDWTGEVLNVADHGNLALYTRDSTKREWVEVWSIV